MRSASDTAFVLAALLTAALCGIVAVDLTIKGLPLNALPAAKWLAVIAMGCSLGCLGALRMVESVVALVVAAVLFFSAQSSASGNDRGHQAVEADCNCPELSAPGTASKPAGSAN